MNKILLLSLLFGIYSNINAQSIKKLTYRYQMDYFKVDEPYSLITNGNEYLYLHHQKEKVFTDNPLNVEWYLPHDYYEFHFNTSRQNVTFKRWLEDQTELHAAFRCNVPWEFHDETKEIKGYKVQKATTRALYAPDGDFGFGDAIVWFTTDLPFVAAPERYCGLPGVVVMIEFTKRKDKIVLSKIEEYDGEIPLPNGGIPATQEQVEHPNFIDKNWLKAEKKKLEQAKGK